MSFACNSPLRRVMAQEEFSAINATENANYAKFKHLQIIVKLITEYVYSDNKASELYSRDPPSQFYCPLGHQQFWLRYFMVFLSPSRRIPAYFLEIGHYSYNSDFISQSTIRGYRT
jgi:hypothetical protein